MTEKYSFFNSAAGDQRQYTAADYAEVQQRLLTDGYIPNRLSELEVTSIELLKTQVDTGEAMIQGRWYQNDKGKELTLQAADSTYDRIDRIVLRLDMSVEERKITAEVKTGVAESNPSAPSLQRDSTIYELSLAQIYVAAGAGSIDGTNITNERNNYDICGIAVPPNRGQNFVNVKDFGAKGDGITDDTEALKNAIENNNFIFIPAGIYITKEQIYINTNKYIIGVGNSWNPTINRDSCITYDGAYTENESIFVLSTEEVGIEPGNAVSNVYIYNIVLDGNSKIDFGLYAARITNDIDIKNITAINTLKHGVWIAKCWYASFVNIIAKNNQGCGITIGRNTFGWVDHYVNSVYFANLRAHSNGLDQTYSQSTKKDWGYGVGIFSNVNLKIDVITSERNYGAGLYLGSISGSQISLNGVYLEGNNETADSDRPWGLIYEGNSNGRAHEINNIYLQGSKSTNGQSIWLTGDEPFGTLELKNIANGNQLTAEWHNYIFTGYCFYDVSNYIIGHMPKSFVSNNITTIYVRDTGDNTNSGRDISNAVSSISAALEIVQYNANTTIINIDGNLSGEDINLNGYNLNKNITIEGNNTAVINSVLQLKNFKENSIMLENISSIHRLSLDNINIKLSNTTIQPDDASATNSLILSNQTHLNVIDCTIDGSESTATYCHGIEISDGSLLTLKNTQVTNFYVGKDFEIISGGGQIISDTDYTEFSNTTFDSNMGVIYSPSNIYLPLITI